MKLPERTSLLIFAGGALAALVGAAFTKSKPVHKLAVHSVAKGLQLKEGAVRKVENIREEAQDVYEEAKRENDEAEALS
ncbi:MAG: DUF6110 family protein [Peptococcaceae bacterium]|jgi:hypothetical protein|nr:DUF6110 family protein [Peptococcaceae bacterium]